LEFAADSPDNIDSQGLELIKGLISTRFN
jgi:hypothetical protein